MTVFSSIVLVLLVSVTLAVPTCKLYLWVNWKDFTCSGAPNSTYAAMDYSGNCTMLPNDPEQSTYKLLIDVKSKTVQSFRAYNFKNCYPGFDLFFVQTPTPLNVCTPAFLYIGPSSSSAMGAAMFACDV